MKEYLLLLNQDEVKKLQLLLIDAYEYNKARNDWNRAYDAKHLEELARDYRLIPFDRKARHVNENEDD